MHEDKKFLQIIGNNLRKIRIDKTISQQELADNSNIAKSTVQRIENGTLNPTILMLKNISEALGTSVEDLIRIK